MSISTHPRVGSLKRYINALWAGGLEIINGIVVNEKPSQTRQARIIHMVIYAYIFPPYAAKNPVGRKRLIRAQG
jgi:hypothetical protein